MSHDPADVVSSMFERAASVTDLPTPGFDALDPRARAEVYEFLDPEIEYREDPRFPEGGVYRGLDAARGYFEQFIGYFDEYVFEAPEMTAIDDDRVLVEFRLRMRGEGSGAAVEASPGWIYTVRDQKITRIEAFFDRSDARQAAGL